MSEDCSIFEDEHFAVLYKEVGEDSQTFFKNHFKHKKYAEAVNRLDKPVSGILIIAFSAKVHEKFNQFFRDKAVKKEYWAICKKTEDLKLNAFSKLSDRLIFNRKNQKAFVCSNEDSKAKDAELFFSVAGLGENYSFLRVFPLTGRTHQIRVQLSNAGMPIKGDLKYGSKRSEKLGGIRLHAYSLEFPHPMSEELLKFCALPRSADNLWQACSEACLAKNSKAE